MAKHLRFAAAAAAAVAFEVSVVVVFQRIYTNPAPLCVRFFVDYTICHRFFVNANSLKTVFT